MYHPKSPSAILIALLFAVLMISASAQSSRSAAVTGHVIGRLKNAATNQYLNNAKVSVEGTDLIAFTDQAGDFRLAGVPAGEHVLVLEYTGLDQKRVPVQVVADGIAQVNASLTSVRRYGDDEDVLKLDRFVVLADKDLNAQTVATNEQRYSGNVKNVLSTEEFGAMVSNSVGEFMKFIPGITVEYSGNEITGFAVRGISGAMNAVTQDGAPLVFGSYSPSSRIFNPYTTDINQTGRIEVTKVPMPSTPADSLGGSINLVSKSVFDNAKAVGHYNVGFNVNSRYVSKLRAAASYGDDFRSTYQPNFSADYSLPLSDKFGIFITAMNFPRVGNNENKRTLYSNGGTSTGASLTKPYLTNVYEMDDPRIYSKMSLSVKADWRVTPNSVLSFNVSAGRNSTFIGDSVRQVNIGANGTPTIPGGHSLTFDDTSSYGATGRGNVILQELTQHFAGGTQSQSINYKYDNGIWEAKALLSRSYSYMEKDNPNGPFAILTAVTRMPVRVNVIGAGYGRMPDKIEVFDNNDKPVDMYDLSNYYILSGYDVFYRNKAEVRNGSFSLKRRLQSLPFQASLEVGGLRMEKDYSNRGVTAESAYNGPDGNPATLDPIPQSFLFQNYSNQSNFSAGRDNYPFLSPSRVYAAWLDNPNLFSPSAAQAVAAETNRRAVSADIHEENTAFYLQADARFFKNRLRVITGVRYEKTVDEGLGPLNDPNAVFVRNADGSFAHDASGARIRKPEAGAAGSLQQLYLTNKELAAKGFGQYDGYYPSLHFSYNLTNNIILRAAYARSFGRPDFLQILPGTTIVEADLGENPDPSAIRGSLTARNSSLKPWHADNYDFSIEYYTKTGGLFTAGAFYKDITDFFASDVRFASQQDIDNLGLSSDYVGWRLSTTFNSGDASITGVELNARQSLVGLGNWGKRITLFANGTKLELKGNEKADFTSFVPESASWGASYRDKRIYLGLKWNYRGKDKRTPDPTFGPDGFLYFRSSVTMDADFSYTLTPRLSISLNVTNLGNASRTSWQTYGPDTPAYAKEYIKFNTGAQYTLSMKGTF